jgi:hypothetical protein
VEVQVLLLFVFQVFQPLQQIKYTLKY